MLLASCPIANFVLCALHNLNNPPLSFVSEDGASPISQPLDTEYLNKSLLFHFQLMDAVPKSEWKPVTVAVAPSTVTINFEDPNEATLDCRVRSVSLVENTTFK